MIRIDDKGCQFTGTSTDIDAEYSQLTSMFIQAKMDGEELSFYDAVDDIVALVQFAVNYHIEERGQTIDWERLKKSHAATRTAMAIYNIATSVNKLKMKISKHEEEFDEDEKEEEDDG